MAGCAHAWWGMSTWAQAGLTPYTLSPNSNSKQVISTDTSWNSEYVRQVSSFTTGPACLAGVIYISAGSYHYQRYRSFAIFSIPAGITIASARLLFTGTVFGSGMNLQVFSASLCSSPPVVGDWPTVANGGKADSGTLLGTFAGIPSPITLDPSTLTPGADIAYGLNTDNDLADVSPGTNNQYMRLVPALYINH